MLSISRKLKIVYVVLFLLPLIIINSLYNKYKGKAFNIEIFPVNNKLNLIALSNILEFDNATLTTISQFTSGYSCSSPQCNNSLTSGRNLKGYRYAYQIFSGYKLNLRPTVCINGRNVELWFDNGNVESKGRGMHVITIDEYGTISKSQLFDTYLSDYYFMRYLKLLPTSNIIILICFDECSASLSPQARRLITKFGSRLIQELKYRENFLMIGQLGLVAGGAVEKIGKKQDPEDKNSFGKMVEISGCLNNPVGDLIPNFKLEAGNIFEEIDGEMMVKPFNGNINGICDLSLSDNTMAINIFIGNSNQDTVRICLNDKIYIDKDLNGAGRGLNIVYINGTNNKVEKVAHFDTFIEDSSSLELLIESMNPGDILILATFDEASAKLTSHVKYLFQHQLGSSMIQNLKYRGAWYFVGKKGIRGFSPFEDMEYPESYGTWAPSINSTFCIDFDIFEGLPTKPEHSVASNNLRYDYCKIHGDFGHFCSDDQVYETLSSAPLIKPGLSYNQIYSTPIYVITGTSPSITRMTLETLSMQPGIRTNIVTVLHEAKPDSFLPQLSNLFDFRSLIMSNHTINGEWKNLINEIIALEPSNDYLMIIPRNVILSPDFIHFMSQALRTLKNSTDLYFVSSLNPYGFENISGTMVSSLFRAKFPSIPSNAALLIKTTYFKRIGDGDIENFNKWDAIFPETSRSYSISLLPDALLMPKRIQNLDPFAWISDTSTVSSSKSYETHLKHLVYDVLSKKVEVKASSDISNICHEALDPKYNSTSLTFLYLESDKPLKQFVKSILLSCYGLSIPNPIDIPIFNHIFRFSYYDQDRFIAYGNNRSLIKM